MASKPTRGGLWPCTQCGRLNLVLEPSAHICAQCSAPPNDIPSWVCKLGEPLPWADIPVVAEAELRQHHLEQQRVKEQVQHEDDPRVALLRTMVNTISSRWSKGDSQKFAWVVDELSELETNFESFTYDELLRKLRALLKQLSYAKGKRHATGQAREQDRPCWSDITNGALHNASWGGEGTRQCAGGQPVRGGALRNGADAVDEHAGRCVASSQNAKMNTNVNEKEPEQTQTLKDGSDMAVVQYVPQVLVPVGKYPAKVFAVDAPAINPYDSMKESVKVHFEITGGKFAGQQLSKNVNLIFAPKSKLLLLWRSTMGSDPEAGSNDTSILVGKTCQIVVVEKDGDEGPYSQIDSFQPPATEKALHGTKDQVPF